MRIVFLHCFFLVILAIAAGCSSAIQSGSGTPKPLVRPNDTAHSTAVPATNPLGYEDLAVDAVDTFLGLLRSEDYEAAADFAISADYLPEEAIPELRDAVATGAIESAAFRLQLEQWCALSVCTEQPLGVSVLTSERGTVIVEAEWPNGLKSVFIVAFVEGTNVLGLPPLKVAA